jgi:hypothetical protein
VIRGSANSPWRGSWISYDHVSTTVGLDKGAELTWNPYYAQSVTIAPRSYLRDDIYVSATWALEQELTDSDWTTKKNELIWSDIFLDVGWSGWTESNSGIRVTPTLRIALPVSKISDATTQMLALAPSVRLSRSFSVLSGLNLSWTGRWTQRFHDSTTAVMDATGMVGCGSDCVDAERLTNTGYLNSWGDFSTGPSVILGLREDLRLNVHMRLGKAFVYDNADATFEWGGEDHEVGSGAYVQNYDGRYSTYFGIGAAYDVLPSTTVSAGISTPSPQLDPEGQRRSLFFNRFTQLGLGVSIDVDVLSSRLFPRG